MLLDPCLSLHLSYTAYLYNILVILYQTWISALSNPANDLPHPNGQ